MEANLGRATRNFGKCNAPTHAWLWLGMAPSLLVAVVALWAPSDVLDGLPIVRVWVDWLIRAIPSMGFYVDSALCPQVAEATFSLAWALFPFQLVYVLYSFMRCTNIVVLVRWVKVCGMTRTQLLTMTWGLAVLASFGLFFLEKDPGMVEHFGVGMSRLSLAFFGACQFWLTAFAISAFCVSVFKTAREDFL